MHNATHNTTHDIQHPFESAVSQHAKPRQSTQQLKARRRFLLQLGSVGAMGLCYGMTAQAESPSAHLSSTQRAMSVLDCRPSAIPTRLFASSNGEGVEAMMAAKDGSVAQAGLSSRNQLALARLGCAGFAVQNPDITRRQYLRFAGTDAQRASDLHNIATGSVVAPKVILVLGWWYGSSRILPLVDWVRLGSVLRERGTIVAGFSDVTAVQCALLAQGGMSSLAAPMFYSEFGKIAPDKMSCENFVRALTDPKLNVEVSDTAGTNVSSSRLPLVLGRASTLTGTLWGGNLSVLTSLVGTAYLPRPSGGVLFLEEVSEPVYRIERMLYQLYLAGVFAGQQAIVLGGISGVLADSYDPRYDVASVIHHLHQLTGLPVFSGFGFGHIGNKVSLPLGARATLQMTASGYRVDFSGYPVLDVAPTAINTEALWLEAGAFA